MRLDGPFSIPEAAARSEEMLRRHLAIVLAGEGLLDLE
jgi:hypothetical protein